MKKSNLPSCVAAALRALTYQKRIPYMEVQYSAEMRTGLCFLCLAYGLVPVDCRDENKFHWVTLRVSESGKELSAKDLVSMPVHAEDVRYAYERLQSGELETLSKEIFV